MRTSFLLAALFVASGCERSAPAPAPSSSAKPTPAPSSTPAASASAPAPTPSAQPVVTFDDDKAGDPPRELEAVVGDWYVAEAGGAKGLKVDGSKWRNGEPSVSLADQAKHLYGERYAEFLDGVKAFAFFPFAVWKGEPPKGDFKISMRFYPEAGRIDQGAGIIFSVAPDGSYWGVRANALEDNLLFFKVVKGKRTVFDTVRNVPTPTKTWHTLVVDFRGKQLTASLDGQKRFEKTLEAAPSGRIGIWSKADSQVLFDDFTVTPAPVP